MSGLHDDQHNEYRRKAARKAKGDHKKQTIWNCAVLLIAGWLAVSALSVSVWAVVR